MAAALERRADISKSDMGRTNPNYPAQFLVYQNKEVKDNAKGMLLSKLATERHLAC